MIQYALCRHFDPAGGKCRDHRRQCRVYLRSNLGCKDFERLPEFFGKGNKSQTAKKK